MCNCTDKAYNKKIFHILISHFVSEAKHETNCMQLVEKECGIRPWYAPLRLHGPITQKITIWIFL